RTIAEAGLRTKKGRGRGAASVTTRDAAHLLIAIFGSAQVKDSVDAVRRYGRTRLHVPTSSKGGFGGLGIVEFGKLKRDHSFVDVLDALIGALAYGAFGQTLVAEAKRYKARPVALAPLIEVAALTPGTAGDLRIAGIERKTVSLRYVLPSPWD